MTTSLRAFLRYLAVAGRCQAGLDGAVPAYAHWQLADMPRYLSTEQVDRLIAACDSDAGARRRDRAILLLLARLGRKRRPEMSRDTHQLDRDRRFADSALEEDGFELAVPPRTEGLREGPSGTMTVSTWS